MATRTLRASTLRPRPKDVLPGVPGLAEHWGRGVVHCPYCHGWEVRDEPIGILATGPASIGHTFLFRPLTEDLTFFAQGAELGEDTRARFAARGIRIIDTLVQEVVNNEDGTLAGVRLADGQVVARSVLAVATRMEARAESLEGLEGLKMPMQDLPDNMGRGFVCGMAGTTEVPGVWVAGNATDLAAQVGAAAAAGAHINSVLATADTDAALAVAAAQDDIPAL